MAPSTKSRMWSFTLFLPADLSAVPPQWKDIIKNIPRDDEWLICQTEKSPTTGRLHLQGCVYFRTPRTLAGTARRFPKGPNGGTVHLEVSRGTPKQNREYCTKAESRWDEPGSWAVEVGTMPVQGARTDLSTLMEYAKDHTVQQCWVEHPVAMARSYRAVEAYKAALVPEQSAKPIIKVLYGPSGTGKSHQCWEEARGPDGTRPVFVMMTPTDRKAKVWMDGYTGEEDIILEDYSGEISYQILLRMFDKYPFRMEVKGATVQWCPKRVFVSSNKHPRDWYPEKEWRGSPLKRRLTEEGSTIIHKIVKYTN